jgi:hypothetical protein
VLDEGFGNLAQLAVGVLLRQCDEKGERLLGAAAALADEDPFGLFNGCPGTHRALELLGDLGLRLVQVHVRQRDPGVGSEGGGELGAVVVEGVLPRAVDVQRRSDLALHRHGDAQRAARAGPGRLLRPVLPAVLRGHVVDGDRLAALDGRQAGAVALLVLPLVERRRELPRGREGRRPASVDQGDRDLGAAPNGALDQLGGHRSFHHGCRCLDTR